MEASLKMTDNYLDILASLSDAMKIRIINKLTESMMAKKKTSKIEDSFGAWKDERSAEDIISDIHNHRLTDTRVIESFDE